MQKKVKKIFFDIHITASELVDETLAFTERILVIVCQYVNKQSQDLRYY